MEVGPWAKFQGARDGIDTRGGCRRSNGMIRIPGVTNGPFFDPENAFLTQKMAFFDPENGLFVTPGSL